MLEEIPALLVGEGLLSVCSVCLLALSPRRFPHARGVRGRSLDTIHSQSAPVLWQPRESEVGRGIASRFEIGGEKMINAVLVFNNNGQPRLTKFYTQLASCPPATNDECGLICGRTQRLSKHFCARSSTSSRQGHHRPATSSLCRLCLRLLAPLPRRMRRPRSPTDTTLHSTSF